MLWRGDVFTSGKKFFELTNHLGNVLVTVTDRKQEVPKNDSVIKYYEPDVVTANDYYPFGMLEPGRSFASLSDANGYRYGFNGKENDNEVKGEDDQLDYGMRIYDPRVGRFLSVDPLMKNYPSWSPYPYAMNRPIDGMDLDGLEWYKCFIPGEGEGAVAIVLKNQYARDVAQGFYDRAKGTVMGVWNVITGKGNGGGNKELARAVSNWHTGIFNDPENLQVPEYFVKTFMKTLEGVIDDYANLIAATFKGDGKAAGALLFEGFLFFFPEAKEANATKLLEEETQALEYAIDAIKNGQRDFTPLEDVVVSTGKDEGVGAMRRLKYEGVSYHGKMDNALKSRGPINGQDALDASLQVKKTSSRRVGIDYTNNEFVVFDETGKGSGVFHGHVRAWKDLNSKMKKTLIDAGMANKKGKILTGNE